MDFTEKTLTQEYQFRGKIMNCRVDTALLPNGKECVREVCEHLGGVGILPITRDGQVLLVRQFRYPYGKTILEIPAGKLDHGAEENVLLGAQRELSEETGLEAAEWTYLGHTLASPGFCDEELHMYLAMDLTEGPCHPDPDEFLEVERVPFDELVDRIMKNEVRDGKTIAAVLRAKEYLARR